MGMNFLILDTYYQSFLDSLRREYPDMGKQSYNRQLKLLLSQFFGTSDFYSSNLRKLGHSAYDLIVNDEVLQKKWATENNLNVKNSLLIDKLRSLPHFYKFIGQPDWLQQIALEQIKKYKPDILYMQNLVILNPETLKKAKQYCKLLVGQIASPLPDDKYLSRFDLILTSFPHFVPLLRKKGINSEYLKIGFDPRVLKKIGRQKKLYNVTFVGGFTPKHAKATKVLESAAQKIKIDVWGRGTEFLSLDSPLRKNYHGEAWGHQMYKILAQSKITLNRHIETAGIYANNMRLYEATGMGVMLITDYKKNIGDIFKVGDEVETYKDANELVEKIKYYLKNDSLRKKIAKGGQRKTLNSHTYYLRMKELVEIIEKYIS